MERYTNPESPDAGRVLAALREARARIEALEGSRFEPLAIVGMGCRFPGGADSPEAFWRLLADGVDAVAEAPPDRWDMDAFYDPDPNAPGKMYTRSGGFLDRVDQFDADFFGISPREAVDLDPQQRLLLEVSWEALEHANLPPRRLSGSRSGVYVGISTFDYAALHLGARDPANINAYFATGNILCMAAGRLSYTLGLTGPSLAVDTACSSSLVSIHLACQSLRNRECDMALAGGVGLILSPMLSINFSRAKMLSPEGKCKTFDAAADGYVRGEGCGVVVLKRLSEALAEGNPVLALIRGSAVNQDGPTAGFTVPSGPSQQRVVREALANAGVTPDQVSYVEAHGTATPLGDPIEMESLGAVFGNRPPENPLLVGSVKTNIGHLEAAAGVAGLIKTVLALQHDRIPPHLHFHTPNPQIAWDRLPVRVPTEGCPWPREKRIAGISSFGASGTNAHIVLEAGNAQRSADRGARGKHDPSEQLLVLSAKTDSALRQLAARYAEHLTRCPDIPIQDICFTAAAGRIHFDHRLSLIALTTAELCEKLHAFSEGVESAGVFSGALAISDDQMPRQRIADNRPDLGELARSYVAGAGVDGGRFFMDRDAGWTQLPTYPFQRERFWIETEPPVSGQSRPDPFDPGPRSHPLLGNRLRLAGARQIIYESRMDLSSTAFLEDHIFHDTVIFPVAACVEMAVAAGAELFGTDRLVLEEVIVRKALVFSADEEKTIQFCVTPSGPDQGNKLMSGSALFHLYSLSDQDGTASWTLHVSGTVAAEENPPIPDRVDLRSLQDRCAEACSGESCYRRFQARGIDLGDAFQVIDHLWRGEHEALSRIRTPEKLESEIGRYRLHPVLFDACIQTTGGVLPENDDATYMPVSIDRVRVDLSSPMLQRRDWSGLWSHIRMHPAEGGQGMKNDLALIDEGGAIGVEVKGLGVRKAPREIVLRELGKETHEIPRDWMCEVVWRPTPRENPQRTPDASGDASDAPGPNGWLIFADRTGLGPRLAELLRARGQQCGLVFDQQTRGSNTAASETEGVAFIDPGNPSEVREIVRRFASRSPLRGVVHLGSIDGDDSPIAGIHTHLQSILHLTQALVGQPLPGSPGLWIVTRGAQPVASVISGISQSPLWGLGRVISLEHPEIPCALIDLDPSGGRDADFTAMARMVLEEVWSPDGEDRIAFRNGLRHTPRLVKRKPSLSAFNAELIRPDAGYLITGGMGALGMQTAGWLADRGARWLALMGRGEPSDAALSEIGRLEAAGVAVRVIRGDVSHHRETADALERIRDAMPPLRGILHAAGVLDDGVLRQQDMARFKNVLAPKVQGAWNLHTLTRDLSLDFFVCFSSAASLLGSVGQGAYAAANAFLDAFIHYRRSQGLPGLSVNWGPWGGAGMSAGPGSRNRDRREDQGIHTVPAKQALRALAQLLRENAIQAAVLPIDWPRYLKRSYRNAPPPFFTGLNRPGEAEALPQTAFIRQLAAAAAADRRFLLETMVRRQVAEVLDVKSPEQIEVRRRLFDAGLDSLMAEEITHGLEHSLGRPLRPTLLFDYPTIEAIVEYLLKEVLDSGFSPEEPKKTNAEDLLKDASEDEIADLLARELATIEAGKET